MGGMGGGMPPGMGGMGGMDMASMMGGMGGAGGAGGMDFVSLASWTISPSELLVVSTGVISLCSQPFLILSRTQPSSQ